MARDDASSLILNWNFGPNELRGLFECAKPFTSWYKCSSFLHTRASPLRRIMSYHPHAFCPSSVNHDDDVPDYEIYDPARSVTVVKHSDEYQTVRTSMPQYSAVHGLQLNVSHNRRSLVVRLGPQPRICLITGN